MSDTPFVLVLLGTLVMPVAASAEPASIRELLKLSCTGDYLEHCSMHAPGGPEVEACFKANMKNLSPGCSAAITAYKQEKRATKRVSEVR